MSARTQSLLRELDAALPDRPFRLELWDGSTLPPTNGGGPTFRARSAQAVGHVVLAPGQLGLGRAYVSGTLEVDDLDAVLALLDSWQPPPIGLREKTRLIGSALLAAGPMRPPRPPAAELRPRGRRHSIARDRRSVRHHYDVSNDYFKLFLDESLTYSCGIFSRGATTLEEAQKTKLELVADKLAITEGDRVLDVGCGWGSFTRLAATRGAQVTGITLSENQAQLARRRAQDEGVADRIDIRVMDWRELRSERFDKIASIGMVEHVGSANIDAYALRLRELVAPGGRVLNHGIARLRHGDAEAGAFSERFVFPDAAPLHVSRIVLAFERAGLPVDHVEGFAADYAETLRHWARRFDSDLEEAVRLGGPERVRVWRLYLRAARRGFESGFTSVYQVRATPPAG
jgi:cyclopropane-fatty-acyl-phospholipid synthase